MPATMRGADGPKARLSPAQGLSEHWQPGRHLRPPPDAGRLTAMRGYDPAALEPFFVAVISAAAALTGLLFVAVSINLDKIVKGPGFLSARAAEALASLLLVLVGSALVLVPQSVRLLGLEILILVVPLLVVTIVKQLSHRRQNPADPLLWTVSRMACTAVATVPGTLAGLSLAVHWGGGLYGWPRPGCWASSARSTVPGFCSSRSSADPPHPR
jgi:hypothetical protein